MRQALAGPLFEDRSFSLDHIMRGWRGFVRQWRQDFAFARYMRDALSGRPVTQAETETARKAVAFAFADIRSPSFHLDDLALPQRNASVHAGRKIVIVRRDKGSELRGSYNLR